MRSYVLGLQDIDTTAGMLVGGKGANLGELSRIAGISVPDGFCLSTEAYKRVVGETPSVRELLDQLALLKVEDRKNISALSGEIRRVIEGSAIPGDIREEIARFLSRSGENQAYALRSSATAEDLPTASFAGQHETYLNVRGTEAILAHISRCWASLFTERAVLYRLHNGLDHRDVQLSVVVQKMVFPQAAGVVFTADPLTSHRKVVAIEACFGSGEALVSGLVNPDSYKVCNGNVIEKRIATGRRAPSALKQEVERERQNRQVLTDEQIVRLERLGRTIEAHFGCPQDIEWCLVDETFAIVQSRPITTLYPIPQADDQAHRVYLSVGHQQMMVAPMKPLGLSFFQLTAFRPMFAAGGRLFVDVTPDLVSGTLVLDAIGQHDPLIKDALLTIIERGDFIQGVPGKQKARGPAQRTKRGMSSADFPPCAYSPTIVADLMQRSQASLAEVKQTIQTKSGAALIDFILEDIQQLKKVVFDPQSSGVLRAAFAASAWINAHMDRWLGEKNVADTLSRSVPHNITSEMGLALLDVADVMRPYPEVIAYLQRANDETFLDGLQTLAGGQETRDALAAFLHTYGMRCVGEIDLTNTRWSEKPTILVPLILGNIKNVAPRASQQKFEQGRREAEHKEQELIHRLKQLPGGERKARETQRMIGLFRKLIGYREYPKYSIVNRYFVYRQALLKEAEQLVRAGVLREKEDSFYLTVQELREVVRTHTVDYQIIGTRKDEFTRFEKLTPPRVITSDGEIVAGKYKREHLPAAALAGLPVSSGVVEGRARVILAMEDVDLADGDIVVTSFTDPSWTPLFVSIKGLVTEVGGLMTHGAVIAREYGLPAVIGVENATRLIQDGARIRVNGTEGYVEILS